MPRMCRGRQWDSVLIPDANPQQQIDDGTITIEAENEQTKEVRGTHVKGGGTPSGISGTCDHGDPNKSRVQLRRREQRQQPGGAITVTIHYSGDLNEGGDDISNGRYRVVGGVTDPDEGTWVGTKPGGDFDEEKEKKEKKEKEGRDAPHEQTSYGS